MISLLGAFVGAVALFARPRRVDGIERTVADRGGLGLHVFTRQLHDGGDGPGWYAHYHVFVRLSDGKVWRAELATHTAEYATGRAGYADGFDGFDRDLWRAGKWRASLDTLRLNTGLALAIDPDAPDLCSGLDVRERPTAAFAVGDVAVRVERTASAHVVRAGGWRVVL